MKPPHAAMTASRGRGRTETECQIRFESQNVTLGNSYPVGLYLMPKFSRSLCSRSGTDNLLTDLIPGMFSDRHVWGTDRPWEEAQHVIHGRRLIRSMRKCAWALFCWNTAPGMHWRSGGTSNFLIHKFPDLALSV